MPILRKPIVWIGARLAAREGTIQRGEGKGLRFNATGGYAGYLLGTSEPEEQELLRRLLRSDDVFYDIGANIGFYSTLAGRMVGCRGKVFAFEPFPASARASRQNAKRNGFSHVTVVEAAVAGKNAVTELTTGDSSAAHKLEEGGNGVKVSVISIDSWRVETKAPPPDVVMIDVEGAEIEVLKGMRNTIVEALPALMIEVHWLGTAFTDYVEDQLAPLGYQVTTYTGDGIPQGITRYHALIIQKRFFDLPHSPMHP